MTEANFASFNNRLRHIDRKHRKLASNYVQFVERDGMMIPVRRTRTRRSIPARGLVLTALVFLVFKGFLVAQLGSTTYDGRVEKLADGSLSEQFGAWLMHADPITMWISNLLAPLL